MKTAIKATLIAAAIAAVGAPAMAQDFGRYRHDDRGYASQGPVRSDRDLRVRIDTLNRQIERNKQTGLLTSAEARRVFYDLRDVRLDLDRVVKSRSGLNAVEHARFDQRLDRVAGQIRDARNDDRFGPRRYRG